MWFFLTTSSHIFPVIDTFDNLKWLHGSLSWACSSCLGPFWDGYRDHFPPLKHVAARTYGLRFRVSARIHSQIGWCLLLADLGAAFLWIRRHRPPMDQSQGSSLCVFMQSTSTFDVGSCSALRPAVSSACLLLYNHSVHNIFKALSRHFSRQIGHSGRRNFKKSKIVLLNFP